jgi:hypothetical protein
MGIDVDRNDTAKYATVGTKRRTAKYMYPINTVAAVSVSNA